MRLLGTGLGLLHTKYSDDGPRALRLGSRLDRKAAKKCATDGAKREAPNEQKIKSLPFQ